MKRCILILIFLTGFYDLLQAQDSVRHELFSAGQARDDSTRMSSW